MTPEQLKTIREAICNLAITTAHSERTEIAANALAILSSIEGEGAEPQPAKVLTDEDSERIARENVMPLADTDVGRAISAACRGFYAEGLRYARDNGYLAPAPPVDIERMVDQIMEVFDRFAGEHVSILHHDFLADSEDILRTSLTNALTPKP